MTERDKRNLRILLILNYSSLFQNTRSGLEQSAAWQRGRGGFTGMQVKSRLESGMR
jgi:hypothetical protein